MTEETPATESADMVAFGSAELGAYTASLIADMDRTGKKVRRDEWEFEEVGGYRLGIRINYAHREQRIHLLWGRQSVHVVSVNIDATDVEFPTLSSLLDELKTRIVGLKTPPPADSSVHRVGE